MLDALIDFLGWNGLSYNDQAAVALWATVGAVSGFVLAMWLLALFGFSPRRAPAPQAKPKPKAPKARTKPKAKSRAKPKGRR